MLLLSENKILWSGHQPKITYFVEYDKRVGNKNSAFLMLRRRVNAVQEGQWPDDRKSWAGLMEPLAGSHIGLPASG